MKKCTDCGREVASQLVYDLPCDKPGCCGTIVFPVDNSVDESVDDVVIDAEIVDDEVVISQAIERAAEIEVRAHADRIVARFVPTPAASTTGDQDETVLRVIDLIDQRVMLLDRAGFSAGGDLLRNLIDAIRSEFAK